MAIVAPTIAAALPLSGTLWNPIDEPPVVNCSAVVSPLDSTPVRSPQAVHSFLTRIFHGRALVEIGSRQGDGISCFGRVTRSAVAVEMARPYCRHLVQRATRLVAPNYSVVCASAFIAGACPDADVYTWWQQGDLTDGKMLAHLRALVRSGKVRQTATAVVLFSSWHRDRRSWRQLQTAATWWREVAFDERPLCRQLLSRSRESSETCARANGTFKVAEFSLLDRQSGRGRARRRR